VTLKVVEKETVEEVQESISAQFRRKYNESPMSKATSGSYLHISVTEDGADMISSSNTYAEDLELLEIGRFLLWSWMFEYDSEGE
jgi:histidinol dehydrogenase